VYNPALIGHADAIVTDTLTAQGPQLSELATVHSCPKIEVRGETQSFENERFRDNA
jgi:hypothetical protein